MRLTMKLPKLKKIASVFVIISAAVLNLTGVALANKPPVPDYWMSIYRGTQKIGYMHVTVDCPKLEGKIVHRERKTVRYFSVALTEKPEWGYDYTLYADSDLNPISETFKESYLEGQKRTTKTLEVTYTPGLLKCDIFRDGNRTKKEIKIPKGTNFREYCRYSMLHRRIKVGDHFRISYLDPWSLTIKTKDFNAECRKQFEVWGETTEEKAMLVSVGSVRTWWADEPYVVLKGEIVGTNIIWLCTDDAVNAKRYDGPYVIVTVDKPIARARLCKDLTLRLVGIPSDWVCGNDSRQTAIYSKESKTAEFQVTVEKFDSSKSLSLPITLDKNDARFSTSSGMEPQKPEVVALSKEIVGDEKNAYKAACKIRKWVSDNIRPELGSSVQLDPVEILKAKRGDCKHCAVLFSAIANAAGIPSRVVHGITYDKDYFILHAWSECFVGEIVAFDPTLYLDYVDATHVKFSSSGSAISIIPRAEVVSSACGDYSYLYATNCTYSDALGGIQTVSVTGCVCVKYADMSKELCPAGTSLVVGPDYIALKKPGKPVGEHLKDYSINIFESGDCQVSPPSEQYLWFAPGDPAVPGIPSN